ncbi:MAG: magnesium transporter [Acidobacteria bacterium]|nr:magnesium transporter [Acidobacteriota bacterium]
MYEALIEHIREALGQRGRAMDVRAIPTLVASLHPSDLAAILDELTLPEAERVFALLDDERAAEALAQAAPATRRHLIQTSPPTHVAAQIGRMEMDDAADVVADIGDDESREILALLPGGSARDVERLLEYPDQTAGRLMTSRFAAVRPGVTVAWTLEYLRVAARTVETVTTVYVVDAGMRLVGVCSVRDLLLARMNDPVDGIMTADVVTVSPETDQQEVARLIGKYDFVAVPVVDAERRLLGIVTVDDVLDVLTEEFNEDISQLVGSDAAEMDRRTPAQVAWLRLPWLLGTMAIELLAGGIIARFGHVLQEVILLASFMPVISAVSGNVGLQAAAIVVRGLDTGHVSLANWATAVRRELLTALTIALCAGVSLAVVAMIWSRRLPFGLVVGASMTCAIVTAGLMGTVIPMLSKRAGFDPAATAGPFETAFQDVIGFSVFLWMAQLLAHWL